MKINLKGIALLLATSMIVGTIFTACANNGNGEGDSTVKSEKESEYSDTEFDLWDTEGFESADSADSSETSESEKDSGDVTEESVPETVDTEKKPVEEETEDTRFEKEYAPVLYFSPEDIAKIAKKYEWGEKGDMTFSSNMLGGFLSQDKSYVTLIPFDGELEACFYLVKGYKKAGPIMVVKYRTDVPDFYMEFFMSSVDESAQTGSNFNVTGLKCDGEWDVKIIDTKAKLPTKLNGESLTYIRFDFANGNPIPPECELDIAYIAFFKTVEDAQKFEYGEDYVPPIGGGEGEEDHNYIDADDIANAINNNTNKNVGSYLLAEDGSYISINSTPGKASDGYINLLSSPVTAGEFFAFRYRTSNSGYWTEFFMDSVNSEATGGSNFTFYPEADGQWHTYVINVKEKFGESLFNGEFVNYIRFDFMNCNDKLGNWKIDVAGLGFFASEEEALEAFESGSEGGDTDKQLPVFIMDGSYIAGKVNDKNTNVKNVESATVSPDGSYVTINPTDGIEESYAYLFTADMGAARYLVFKFRTTSKNFYIQMYLNSGDHTAGNGSISIEGFSTNGDWVTLVYDLNEKLGTERFNGNSLGHFRFDFINMSGGNKTDANTSIDIAYVAFFSSLEAANNYESREEDGGEEGDVTPAFVMDGSYIADKVNEKATKIESATVSPDGSYVTINPTDGIEESYAYLFTTDTEAARYMVVRFRTTSKNFYIQTYLNTVDHTAGGGKINIEGFATDGEWVTFVYDLNQKIGTEKFNGKTLGHFRFDFINMSGGNKTDANTSIDIAYVAFFTSLEAANSYAAK